MTKSKEEKPITQAQQVRYALARVEAIRQAKVKAIHDAHKRRYGDWRSRHIDAAMTEEIAAGRAKVVPERVRAAKADAELHTVMTFTRFPGGKADVEATLTAAEEERDRQAEAVRAEATRICDGLVLGDAPEALRALAAFEAREF